MVGNSIIAWSQMRVVVFIGDESRFVGAEVSFEMALDVSDKVLFHLNRKGWLLLVLGSSFKDLELIF